MTEPLARIGVVADTHVPDRVNCLHPALLPALRAARPDLILHAGDISTLGVVETLREVAPVEVARGNRDWELRGKNGLVNRLEVSGVGIALMHGHGGWLPYLIDKFFYIAQGYRFYRYRPLLLRAGRGARVIVFGHTHYPVNFWIGEQLVFNPGAAWRNFGSIINPSWGLLKIYSEGRVEGEIHEMPGYRAQRGGWVKISSES